MKAGSRWALPGALEFEGRWITWGQLTSTKAGLERHLASRGCGERGAVLMGNRPQIVWPPFTRDWMAKSSFTRRIGNACRQ